VAKKKQWHPVFAELWELYGRWLAALYHAGKEEVHVMARKTKEPLRLDLTPIIKTMGMEWLIQQLGAKQVIEELGPKEVIQHLGWKRVIDALGGVEQVWAELTPEQRCQLKRLA